VLKDAVKPRTEPATLPFETIVQKTELPQRWVYHMLEGHVLHRLAPHRGYRLLVEKRDGVDSADVWPGDRIGVNGTNAMIEFGG
jgi:hypothetical protein